MVMKEPDKYGNKIMKANDLYVVQINTSQIYKDCEDKYTYAILCDNDLNIYQIYMMGELFSRRAINYLIRCARCGRV